MDNLRWVRLLCPSHIPAQLVQQVKERNYSVEDFYLWHEAHCLSEEPDQIFNPLNHLYGLMQGPPDPKMVGFIWFTIDPLTKSMWVHTFSINSDLWNKGKAIELAQEILLKVKEGAKLKQVFWISTHPQYHEKYGFKRSKSVLMEYGGDNG